MWGLFGACPWLILGPSLAKPGVSTMVFSILKVTGATRYMETEPEHIGPGDSNAEEFLGVLVLKAF